MRQQTFVTTAGQPTIQQQQPNQAVRNVGCTRGLGITQLVIGSLTLLLGIVATAVLGGGMSQWVVSSGCSIWGGIWIGITGIIGICSSQHPGNGGLNGFNMAFSIIGTIIAFLDGIFYIIATLYYSTCQFYRNYDIWSSSRYGYGDFACQDKGAGAGIHGVLMLLMAIEFFVALIAAVYCCQSCCGNTTRGGAVIMTTGQPNMTVITSSAPGPVYSQQQAYPMNTQQPMMQAGYAPQQGAYPPQQGAYPPQQGAYPPQQQQGFPAQPQGAYPQQGFVSQQQQQQPQQQQQQPGYPTASQQGYPQQQMATNVTYSQPPQAQQGGMPMKYDAPPPAYTQQ